MEYILLAGPILFIVITIILGQITPNYSHKENYISELSLGKYGLIQKINFMVSGLLISGLGLFIATYSQNLVIKLGWGLAIIAGFLLVLTGIWDTDYDKPKRTMSGRIHDSIYNFMMPTTGVAYLLLGWGHKNNPIILILSWLIALSSFVLYKFSKKIGLKHGLSQRIVFFSAAVWMEILAIISIFK